MSSQQSIENLIADRYASALYELSSETNCVDEVLSDLKIINKYKCIDDTIDRAKHFANIAKDSLGIFDDSEYKEIFTNLVNSGLTRLN